MKQLFIEADYLGIVVIILAVMFGLPLLFIIIGLFNIKRKKATAKIFFIMAGIYLIISLGICGSIML